MKDKCFAGDGNRSITYTFTQNRDLIESYSLLRKRIYMQEFNLDDFSDHEDGLDGKPYTYFIIIRDGETVIGGARLIVRRKHSHVLLPLETPTMRMQDMLPDILLKGKAYGEIDRTVLEPSYRQGAIAQENMRQIALASKELGMDYMFSIGPAVQIRNNRRHCAHWGIDFHILNTVKVPDQPCYRGRQMYLSLSDINTQFPERREGELLNPDVPVTMPMEEPFYLVHNVAEAALTTAL